MSDRRVDANKVIDRYRQKLSEATLEIALLEVKLEELEDAISEMKVSEAHQVTPITGEVVE